MEKQIIKSQHKTIPHPKLTNRMKGIFNQYNTLLQEINNDVWTKTQRTRLTQL